MTGWHRKILRRAGLLLLLIWPSLAAAAGPAVMHLVTGFGRETPQYRRFELLYADAFKRLGMEFRLTSLPKEQALQDANKGLYDGDASRVLELENHPDYPNLIRVDVTTNRNFNVAFTVQPRPLVSNWEDIRAQNLTIAYPRGQIFNQVRVREFQIPASRVLLGENCEEMLNWLKSGKVDLYLDNLGNCWETRNSERYPTLQVATVLGEDLNFPYLHRKHKDLVPRLAEALKASLADPVLHARLAELEREKFALRRGVTWVQLYTPYDFAPFVVDRSMQTGLIYDFQRFLNALGDGRYYFELQTVPRIPSERLRKSKELAIVPFVTKIWFDDEKNEHFDWTVPLYEDDNIIVSNKSAPVESITPERVRGKAICGSAGLKRDATLQKMINGKLIKLIISPNVNHCLLMVAHKRADFYVAGRLLLNYFLQEAEFAQQLYVSPSPVRHLTRRILIAPKGTELLNWLNPRVESMDRNAVWQRVLKSYHAR